MWLDVQAMPPADPGAARDAMAALVEAEWDALSDLRRRYSGGTCPTLPVLIRAPPPACTSQEWQAASSPALCRAPNDEAPSVECCCITAPHAASLRPMLCTLVLWCVDQVIGCLQAPEGGTSVPGAPRSILKRHSSARTPSPMPVKAPVPVPPSAASPRSPSRPGALPTTSPAIASSAAPPASPLACNLLAALASPELQTRGSHSRSPATPPALKTEIAAANASTLPSCRFLSTDSSPLKKSQQAAQVLAQKQVLPLPLARRAGSARAQAFLQASLGSPIKRQRVAV